MKHNLFVYSMLYIVFSLVGFVLANNQPGPEQVPQPMSAAPKQTLNSRLKSFTQQVIGLFATPQDGPSDVASAINTNLSKVSDEAANPKKLYEPTHNWYPIYHSQVGPSVFTLIDYPYGVNGIRYDQPQVYPLAEMQNTVSPTKSSDPNDVHSPKSLQESQALMLEKWCELVHQWRRLNEAPVLATEVVHAAGLTRAQVRIYQMNPQLAVDIKRTLGRIGSMNKTFDLTSRMVLRDILGGQTDTNVCLEMEKQLADLESLMDRLAETDDIVSIALGVGPINRKDWNAVLADPIDYSHFDTQTVAKP